MPDSANHSNARRAWRAMSALGCLLGAISILLTAVKWTDTDTRQDDQARIANQAICAIVLYAEDAAARASATGNRAATDSLLKLSISMRATGIDCPEYVPATGTPTASPSPDGTP